jgi:alkylation response protein AidB-like acyl-CoA dehydrogenase
MASYKAPLRDMQFVLNELLECEQHYAGLQGCETVTPELLMAILDGARQYAEDVAAPLNAVGDVEGCRFESGDVATPAGFKDAFRQYCDAGWQGLNVAVAEGGQGVPGSVGVCTGEMIGSANWALSMYAGLAHAPLNCLLNAGDEVLKNKFAPKLVSGEWAGTMCLTESHCGSDVGLVRTRAVANADGTYMLTGTKIFISGGEQDITPNIIHSVLARIDGAPAGTKGISLFIVPKFLVNDDGSLGARNAVHCGSIEKKMGLKGSATCVMNFDGATGYLLGAPNRGLDSMFKIMNMARLGTAMQGLAMGEPAFQGALQYAKDRLQMRALSGSKNPAGEADPIIVHADVRRMLLTQKALNEGSRAFIYWLAQLVDQTRFGSPEQAQSAEELLGLLTPIAKAFCTETAVEVTNTGIQVFGGHGYIHEHGMEQIVRDARIATIYEGTTGIQALDLMGRKVLGSGGKLLRNFTRLIHKFCEANAGDEAMKEFCEPLAALNKEWGELTAKLGERIMQNVDELGACSVDYTMYSGYIALAYMWAQMAQVAAPKTVGDDAAFYQAKLATARFYFKRLLPRTKAHFDAALAGSDTVMTIAEDAFAF